MGPLAMATVQAAPTCKATAAPRLPEAASFWAACVMPTRRLPACRQAQRSGALVRGSIIKVIIKAVASVTRTQSLT